MNDATNQTSGRRKHREQRPSISVHFRCCNVYARVYLNAQRTAFAGHCPRCATPVHIRASENGDPSRFWSVE